MAENRLNIVAKYRVLCTITLLIFLAVCTFLSLTFIDSTKGSRNAILQNFPAHVVPQDPSYLHFTRPSVDRQSDISDTFVKYKDRSKCGISSLDLHAPFSPLCPDRLSVLEAMSHGGRVGLDAPYLPRGCDMRWYSSEEICEILSRFDQVMLFGDSLIRHVTNALWIYIRGDLGYGAINAERARHGTSDGRVKTMETCRCEGQFSHKSCSVLLFQDTKDALNKVSESLVCKAGSFNVQYRDGREWPITNEVLQSLTNGFPHKRPAKPIALIVDHCLHNDANVTITEFYMKQLEQHLATTVTWLNSSDRAIIMPKLYVSSSVGGRRKKAWAWHQGVHMLDNFEHDIDPIVRDMGYEFLGTYNMSVQASSFDGTHMNIDGNLLKAMMVLNWLANLEIPTSTMITGDEQRLYNNSMI